MTNKICNLVACGGTFDHLHKGHKHFLRQVFSFGNNVLIGLTSDNYINNNNLKTGIEPFEIRKKILRNFLDKEKIHEADIVAINDIYGPTLKKNLKIDALVVSEESAKGGEVINTARKKAGLPELKIIVESMLKGEDGKVISSRRIRNGEINREGRLYINPSWIDFKLILTDEIRKELKKPFGRLHRQGIIKFSEFNYSKVVTVGDAITKYFNERNLGQKISVIDFLVERKEKFSSLSQFGFTGKEKLVKVHNPPGCIMPSFFKIIPEILKIESNLFNKCNFILKVDGEEDLSVLPFLLSLPLGFTIFYGQPKEGVVQVDVNEENKEKAYNILNKFKIET